MTLKNIKWDLTIFILLLLALVITVKNDLDMLANLKKQNEKMSVMVKQETERKQYLLKKLRSLNSDDDIELIARQKLGLVKSGETAYKIIYNK
ncbi:MAG: septum formation initiator family protein [Candidatus Saganbacteria bacterium]|nr:septum formation initiator family protein [Candidatus Saganbacteria bacterium]